MMRAFLVLAICVCVSAYPNRQYYNGRSDIYQGGFYNGGRFYNRDPYVDSRPNQRCNRPLTRRDCRLFDFKSDLVTKEDFLNTVLTGDGTWIPIYSIEIDTPANYGKCRYRFNSPGEDGVFLKEELCFNLESKQCEDFTGTMTLTEDECGRAQLQGVNITTVQTIYSQDLNQYFWRDICDAETGDGGCENGRFIDLTVRGDILVDTENGRIADLTSLQWELFAADLKNIYDRDFSDPKVRFVEIEEECRLPE